VDVQFFADGTVMAAGGGKSSEPATSGGEILMPGEIEERTKARRLRNGIDLDQTTWTQICETARAVGVSASETALP